MFVYILFSPSINRYYTGHTNSLSYRIKKYNDRQVASTRRGAPWEIIWFTTTENRSKAITFEKKIKNRGVNRFLVDFFERDVAQPG